MRKNTTKFQAFKFNVTQANQNISIDFNTDASYERITGLSLNTNDNQNKGLVGSVFNELKIDKEEIFPKDMPVEYLYSNNGVSLDQRFYPINNNGRGVKINGAYVDGGKASAYPYVVYLIIRLDNGIVSNDPEINA